MARAALLLGAFVLALAILSPPEGGRLFGGVSTAGADTLRVWFASRAPSPPFRDWAGATHSVQEAVDSARAGDVVLIRADTARAYSEPRKRPYAGPPGTQYSAFEAIVFPKAGVSIVGEENGPLPILSGGDSVRTVAFRDSTLHSRLERVRLRNGGILFVGHFDSTTVVRRCVIERCRQMEGGGMRIMGPAAPLIEENLFVSNRSDSTLHHRNGGALAIDGEFPPPRALIRRNVFRANRSWNMGGAIRVKFGAPYIEANLFDRNDTEGDGGAIAVQGGKPRIFGNTFRGNRARGFGGAIATIRSMESQGLNVHDNVFEEDSANAGGAIELSERGVHKAEYKILNNTFVRCHAESAGAALFVCGESADAHEIWVNRNVFVAESGRGVPQADCAVTGAGEILDSLACNRFFVGGGDSVAGGDSAARGPSCRTGVVTGNAFADPAGLPGGAFDSTFAKALRGATAPACAETVGAR